MSASGGGPDGLETVRVRPSAAFRHHPFPLASEVLPASLASSLEGWMKHKYTDPFYRSRRWERLRAAVLRRDGYMCQEARRYGKRAEATTVHHVFPRDEFPEYQWEAWNLVSLAGDVHDQMHDRVTGALTEKGAEWLRRVARKNGVEVPGRYRA